MKLVNIIIQIFYRIQLQEFVIISFILLSFGLSPYFEYYWDFPLEKDVALQYWEEYPIPIPNVNITYPMMESDIVKDLEENYLSPNPYGDCSYFMIPFLTITEFQICRINNI